MDYLLPSSWQPRAVVGLALTALTLAAIGPTSSAVAKSSPAKSTFNGTLRVGAIPDQDPEKLQRTYGLVSRYLQAKLPGVKVKYVPVTDYQAAVAAFRTGDLDLVWFGGLTGVQARNEVKGSTAIAQRDIDAKFTSVFIANTQAAVAPITSVSGLTALRGKSFTFGSESSTSGRVMPQYFLSQAGIDADTDLAGRPGFSGAHDKTLELVSSGTFQAGALNSQVWDTKVKDGTVDASKVVAVFRTPPYVDYHWVLQPKLDKRFGTGFSKAVTKAILELNGNSTQEKDILALFGAKSFIPTNANAYRAIETIALKIGVLRRR